MTDEFYAKIETARKRGVSDAAIRKFLADHPLVESARQKGVSDDKIFSYLGLAPPAPAAASEADEILGNIPEDVMALGQSLTPRPLSRAITHAVVSPLQTGKELVAGVSEFLQHPYESFKARPVSTALNIAPAGMLAAKGVGAARGFLAPVLEPQRAAVANVMSKLSDPQAFANAMARPVPVTPGAPAATATQAAVASGLSEPAVAGLEADVMDVSKPFGREVFALSEQRMSAMQQQLQRIKDDIQQRGASMSPEALASLKTARDDLLRQIAQERSALTAQGAALEQQLPAVSQARVGETIQTTAQGIRTSLQRHVIRPAYERPLKAAGEAKIDITPVVREAERILGRPLTDFQPETAPNALARELSALRPPPARGEWVPLAEGAGYYGEPGPPPPTTATLRQIDAIRRGINADLSAAAKATDAGAATRYSQLRALSNQLNKSVQQSEAISDTVRAQYEAANQIYAEQYAPRVKTGITADMLQQTARGVTKLLPDDVVDAVLANETNAEQFARTFSNNTVARDALRAGIIDRVRTKALDPATGFILPEKIAAFAQTPALNALNIDLRTALQPLMDEAARVNQGLTELTQRAKKLRKATAEEVVTVALKNAPEMDFLLRSVSEPARDAVRKEATDRALALIKSEEPGKALAFLAKHDKALTVAIGRDAVTDLKQLADAQQLVIDAAKATPVPRKSVAVGLDGFTRQQLLDLQVVIDEERRVEEALNLARVRPTADTAALAAEQGVSGGSIPSFLKVSVTLTKAVLDHLSDFATRKMQVQTAKLLVQDRELLGQLINEALAKKKAPSRLAPALAGAAAADVGDRK